MQTSLPPFEPWSIFAGRDGHRMTIATTLDRRRFTLTARTAQRHYLEVSPGNTVQYFLHDNGPAAIIIVHGLESSAQAQYVRGICEKALHSGLTAVRLDLRNCGGTMHLCQTLYNAGLSADVLALARSLKTDKKYQRVYAIGYSLGGNIVLKALGEDDARARERLLDGGVAVCPPAELAECVAAMEKNGRLYELNFLLSLKRKLRQKSRLFPSVYGTRDRINIAMQKLKTLRDFDHHITAPDAGYATGDDYYHGASAMRVVSRITAPTLILTSADDPMVPVASLQQDAVLKNENIFLEVVSGGGHCGFIHKEAVALDNKSPRDRYWAEWRALEYCLALEAMHKSLPVVTDM